MILSLKFLQIIKIIVYDIMQQLKEYKKLLKIKCVQLKSNKTRTHKFQVSLQQLQPHSVFRYQIQKTKEEFIKMLNILANQLFNFNHPYSRTFVEFNQTELLKILNQFLKQINSRLDVITNMNFVNFFGIHFHYDDFLVSLSQEKNISAFHIKKQEQLKQKNKQNKIIFNSFLHILQRKAQVKIQIGNNIIKDIILVNSQKLLFYVLQTQRQNKISGFFKNILNKNKQYGWINIFNIQNKKAVKLWSQKLLSEAFQIKFIHKYSMLYVMSPVGIYLYTSSISKQQQQLQLFIFVQIQNCISVAFSLLRGQLFLLKKNPGQLSVYNINNQINIKTKMTLKQPQCLCLQDQNSRLYVSDSQGIHILLLGQFGQLSLLHLVKIDFSIRNMQIFQFYLLCLSQEGRVVVFELQKPKKQQLTSPISEFKVPPQTKQLTLLPNNLRIVCSAFNQSLSIIHTFQGPLFSIKSIYGKILKSIVGNDGKVFSVTDNGKLEYFQMNNKYY